MTNYNKFIIIITIFNPKQGLSMSKRPRPYTFRGNGKTTCKCCEAKITKNSLYFEACSPDCAKELTELRAIPLSPLFVISLLNRTKSRNEIETQLKKYIQRHGLEEWKTLRKFDDIANQVAKFGFQSIRRKELALA